MGFVVHQRLLSNAVWSLRCALVVVYVGAVDITGVLKSQAYWAEYGAHSLHGGGNLDGPDMEEPGLSFLERESDNWPRQSEACPRRGHWQPLR